MTFGCFLEPVSEGKSPEKPGIDSLSQVQEAFDSFKIH